MRRNSFLTFLKEKSFIIVLTLMLVSAGTMAALFAMGGDDATEENQVAEQQVLPQENASTESGSGNDARVKNGAGQNQDGSAVKSEKTDDSKNNAGNRTAVTKKTTDTNEETKKDTSGTESAQMAIELEDQYLEAEEMAEVSGADVVAEGFSEVPVLSLKWPVSGEVLLEFSMDHSIYFPTLAQYQYNPAMIISASEGTEVFTAAAGTVTDVGKTNEYGHYVTMDLGDGFEITYGQLFDINTEVGEVLEAGERIAMVAYPTRNYSAEGDNLYLKLTQNEVPVDPELYLEK